MRSFAADEESQVGGILKMRSCKKRPNAMYLRWKRARMRAEQALCAFALQMQAKRDLQQEAESLTAA